MTPNSSHSPRSTQPTPSREATAKLAPGRPQPIRASPSHPPHRILNHKTTLTQTPQLEERSSRGLQNPSVDASLAPCKNFFSNNLGSKNIHINTTVSHHHNSTPNLVATNNISLEHPTPTHHQHSNQQKIQPDNSAHTYIVNILHTNEISNKQLKLLQQTQNQTITTCIIQSSETTLDTITHCSRPVSDPASQSKDPGFESHSSQFFLNPQNSRPTPPSIIKTSARPIQ
jgi:hypothetical protein